MASRQTVKLTASPRCGWRPSVNHARARGGRGRRARGVGADGPVPGGEVGAMRAPRRAAAAGRTEGRQLTDRTRAVGDELSKQ